MQNDEPLPGYSVKIPFIEPEEKLLNFRSRRSNTDEVRKGLLNRWELEELSYFKKLEKMKKENLENRIKLEKSLYEQCVEILEPPKPTLQTISYGKSNERPLQIPIQVSGGNHRRVLVEIGKKEELLITQRSSRKRKRRLSYGEEILDGIKETQEENIRNSSEFKDKQKPVKIEDTIKNKEKRLEYEWVRRVRIAKGNTKLYQNDTDEDESCSSQEDKNHQPIETLNKKSESQKRSHFRYPLTQRERNPSNSYAKNSFDLDEDSSLGRMSRYNRKNRGISTEHNQFKSLQNSEEKGKNGHLFPKTHSRYINKL